MAKNVVNLRPLQLGVDGYDNSPCFQTAEVRNGEFRPVQKVKCDPVPWFQPRRQQIAGYVICKSIELCVGLRVCWPNTMAGFSGFRVRECFKPAVRDIFHRE